MTPPPRALIASTLAAVTLGGCPTPAPQSTADGAEEASPPAPRTDEWRVTGDERAVATRGSARLFIYRGPPDLDRGLPGITEDQGRGPAYGLLGGYFAPRLLATASSSTAVPQADGPSLRIALPGLRVTALPPLAAGESPRRMTLRVDGSGTLVFPADRTVVEGTLAERPSFSVTVSAGAAPGYRGWPADRLFIRPRRGRSFRITTDCPRITLIHPVPKGSTSVFLLHLGPAPPPTDPLFAPVGPVPEDVRRPQGQCAATTTSTLTVALP